MMKKLFFSTFTLLCFALTSNSQVRYAVHTTGIYNTSESKVQLRWAPLNINTWSQGITEGYRIVRFTVFDGTDTLSSHDYASSYTVIDSLVFHLPENDWTLVQADTNITGFAQAALFDDDAEPEFLGSSEYVQASNAMQAEETRFNFGLLAADRSYEVAKAMGLGYDDLSAVPGRIYDYMIRVNNIPAGNTIGGRKVRVKAAPVSPNLPIPEFSWGMGRDKRVLLNWSVPVEEDVYVGYYLDRYTGSSFVPINDLPVSALAEENLQEANYSFLDSVAYNFQNYIYRVRGIDIWGRYGAWSDTIHVYCLPSPITTAPYISNLTENASSVVLSWTFPDSLEARIDGFKILRSNLPNGNFQPVSSLIGKHLRTWTDNFPIPTAYYRISIKDDTDTELSSFEKLFQLEDTEPPGAPISLAGTCDPSGKIQLNWKAPSDPDVRGYRVFTSYNETGDILERTTEPVKDTMFTFYEDIKRNNKFIHVYVQALDFHANYSEMAKNKVRIYDIVPPSAPQLLHVGQHPYGFILDVKSSPDTDVEIYKIQRRLGSDNEWSTMHTISDWTTSGLFTVIDNDRATWIDTTTLPSIPHVYRIIAEDEAGNAGTSKTKYVDPHQVGNRPAIQNANVSMFTTGPGKFMRVGWSYGDSNDIESYQIYRQVNQYSMLSYRSTSGTSSEAAEDWPGVTIPSGQGELFFVDLLLDNSGNLYNTSIPVDRVRYRVVARHYDGTTSPLSTVIELIF